MFAGIVLALLSWAPAQAGEPAIVAAGDSITNGGGTAHPRRDSWPAIMGIGAAGVGGACIVTEGCASGTPPFVKTYNRDVLARKPDVVIVAFGMNDLYLSTPKEITDGMKELKRRNDARGIVTYVATLTPVGDRMKALDPARKELNQRIKKRFDAWRVIDFNAALRGPGGRLPSRYDSGDGLHPNARAYGVMARVAWRTLSRHAH